MFHLKSRIATAVLAAGFLFSGAAGATALTENFDNGVPAGWTVTNLSNPIGTTSWFQGNPAVFAAQSGAANSYVGANFNSGSGEAADLSTWLILPTSVYNNGDTLSFWTRTAGADFPDSLELRFSATGGTNVGNSATSVGSFTSLLLSINPDLNQGGYPEDWTQFSVTLSGLGADTNGAFAFRYVVADGGPLSDVSNYIGIDSVQVTAVTPPAPGEVPEPAMFATMGLGLGMLAMARRRRMK